MRNKLPRRLIVFLIAVFLMSCESYFAWTLPNPFLRIKTEQPENVTSRTAELYGSIENINDSTVLGDIGFVYSQDPNVNILNADFITGSGAPIFSANLTGLLPETKYYFRAYVEDAGTIYYGNEVSFTTSEAQLSIVNTIPCNTLSGVNSLLSQLGPGPDEWDISTNGYEGNCWFADDAYGINWVEFQISLVNEGLLKFWVQTFNPGYSNKLPTIYVDGISIGEALQVGGDQSSWNFMQVETPLIDAGAHLLRIEINTGSVYNDISVDEIEIYEYD